MKTIKLLCLVGILLEITSCKKLNYETTSVKVFVFDENLQLFVANQKITLYEVEIIKSLGGMGRDRLKSTILKEVYTDADGLADFGTFQAKRSNKYFYFIDDDNAGVDYTANSGPKIKRGESNTFTFTVDASVDIFVKFLPPPPYNSGDSLSVSFNNILFPTYQYKITNTNYSAQHSNFTILPGYIYFNIEKYKSGIYTITSDTVFYPACSTNEYDVYW